MVKPPKVERKQLNTYDIQQTAELLERLRGNHMFIPRSWPASAASGEERSRLFNGSTSIYSVGRFP